MKHRLLRFGAVACAVLIALVFFGILTTLLDAAGYSSTESASASVDTPSLTVMERRAISIPFGISSPLTITADGGQVFVTGHGVCWDDGQLFDVHPMCNFLAGDKVV